MAHALVEDLQRLMLSSIFSVRFGDSFHKQSKIDCFVSIDY